LVAKYVTEWVVGDNNDHVLLEVVLSIPRGDEYCVE
jgi:hypothetical protein